jgi:hypothetical protein
MLQFVVRSTESDELRSWVCDQFPFKIGRSATSNLTLEAPGVWEDHAEIVRDQNCDKLLIQTQNEALLLVNGVPVTRRILCPGDEIKIGAVTFQVALSPAEQKRLSVRESIVWVLLCVVFIVQSFLIAALK